MGLGRLQSQARNSGHSDIVTLAVRTVFDPLSGALGSASNGVADFFQGVFNANSLVLENRRLKSLESAAALYNEQIARYEEEVKRLRGMIELADVAGKTKVPAVVTGYFPNESRATANIGQGKGIKKGMPVIAGEGLYGYVQTVDKGSCQILLISSPQFKIMGRVQRDPPPLGFITGQNTGSMVFDVVDAKALPQTGDMVFTSGLSERIPAGIPIGKIVQIEEDVAYGSKRCQVFPGVQVGAVREVYILK